MDPENGADIPRGELPEPPEWEWKRPPAPKQQQPLIEGSHYARGMGLALAIGSSFVGPVLGGILIGGLIDGRLGGPFTLVGLLVGSVAAFVLLIRLVNKLNETPK